LNSEKKPVPPVSHSLEISLGNLPWFAHLPSNERAGIDYVLNALLYGFYDLVSAASTDLFSANLAALTKTPDQKCQRFVPV